MAEGAPLLREYAGKTCIKGSNPFRSAKWPRDELPAALEWKASQRGARAKGGKSCMETGAGEAR